MTTKQKILNESLTLFAEKGYSAVYVGDIANAVGIKAEYIEGNVIFQTFTMYDVLINYKKFFPKV